MSLLKINPYNNYNTVKPVQGTSVKNDKQNVSQPAPSAAFTSIPFGASASKIRTKLSSKDEKNKYNELLSFADKDTKKLLNVIL